MYTFLIVLISLVAIVLCVIILVQSGKGGGLAAAFGGASSSTDSFMGGRQAANVLTRATWIGGGVFLALAMLLAVLSSRPDQAPESILRQGIGDTPNQPPPTLLDAPPSLGEAVGGEAAGEGGAGAGDSGSGDDSGSDDDTDGGS